ncbi:hypothetical protein [Microbulbifer sp. THAF38]|uniref:hypothetical protein n=1 Tax=Microbulbifer sp. THAF38 TaxID=2587856 RepID=UPI0012687E20|nr:hypothetical protein [Microbulbifer sp. THAF38]
MLAEKWPCCHFSEVALHRPAEKNPTWMCSVCTGHPWSVAAHPRAALGEAFGFLSRATTVGVTGMGQ